MLTLRNNRDERTKERVCFEKKVYDLNKVHYLPMSPLGRLLVLCFIASDFIFIKQLVDAYFTQSVWQVWAASAVIACLIDVSPSILAGCLMVKEKKRMHYIGMLVTMFALLGTFSVLALLRLNSADLIYQTSNNQIVSLLSVAEDTQTVHEKGYMWMSVLFCIMPVFTSIVSFMIGLFENTKNEETYIKKIVAIESQEELFDLEADNMELELELERALDEVNNKRRDLEISDIENRKTIAKALVKFKMAHAVGTPQALTNFMEN